MIPIVEGASILIFGFWAGGIALKYYVTIRRPDRHELELFKDRLPKALQFIYFNPRNSAIYGGETTNYSGLDYLLFVKRTRNLVLVQWVALVFVTALLVILFDVFYFYRDGSIEFDRVFYDFMIIIVYLRVSFFGFKLKRSDEQ